MIGFNLEQIGMDKIDDLSIREVESFLTVAEIKLRNGYTFSGLDEALLFYYLQHFSENRNNYAVKHAPEFWYLRQG
jgi:hypothetical protein